MVDILTTSRLIFWDWCEWAKLAFWYFIYANWHI